LGWQGDNPIAAWLSVGETTNGRVFGVLATNLYFLTNNSYIDR
jgi:hypothetical protein